ncbi:MAG: 1,2-phenylacetyl-CoA epoxidase subunit PaaC [Rhodanobacteraceae bacterium]
MGDHARESKFEYLLRLGDSTLILAQRLSAWCGKGPVLEEDMALANTALDLLGHARMWLQYAAEVEGKGRDEDQLAFLRDSRGFRNLLLVEQDNGNYADTLMRQFYFDAWHRPALAELQRSSDATIAGIAEKALKEVDYHLRRSRDLIVRVGDGTEYSHGLVQTAAERLWIFTGELFAGDAVDREMAEAGIGFDPALVREPWQATVTATFRDATLELPPADAFMRTGGRSGLHGEILGHLLAEMQVLPRSHPGAGW